MKRMQKFISLWLVFCLVLSMVPVQVFAEDTGEKAEFQKISLTISGEQEYGSDELYAAYAESLFYGGISLFGNAAGNRLTGDERVIYDALVPMIRQIANGERASATITIGQDVTYDGVFYPVDQEAQFIGSNLTDEMLNRVVDALLADLPFECYWYEKTTGCTCSAIMGETIQQVILKYTVADNYQDGDLYTVDTAKTGLAKAAADKAMSIVSANSHLSDYDKLIAYRDAICDLVSYDDAAADGNYFDTDIDPWQLISVFDGDSSTNVVCEGYSKAFMYLCDITDFAGDVDCYTVSGNMDGGAHMWNVVEINGKHYLADVTNSDTGTVGENGSLFLAGATGTTASSYSVAGISYVYDSDTLSLWGTGAESILTLEATGYTLDAEGEGEIASGTCGENVTWTLVDGELTISGTGEMEDYSYTTQPWYAYKNSISSVVFSEDITKIGECAFYNYGNLVSVSIPKGVTSIGNTAFYSCINLTNFTIPEGVCSIGEHVLAFCCSLKSITIPESVTYIGDYAFGWCEGLSEIIFEGNALAIAAHTFIDNNSIVYYPADNCTWTDDVMQDYGGTITWAVIGSDVDPGDGEDSGSDEGSGEGTGDGSGSGEGSGGGSGSGSGSGEGFGEGSGDGSGSGEGAGEGSGSGEGSGEGTGGGSGGGGASTPDNPVISDITWNYVNRVLTIQGNGAMPDYGRYGSPWNDYWPNIEKVVISDGITSIGTYAFYQCVELVSVDIPDTVTRIEANAFDCCFELESVELPSGITYIGDSAFADCKLAELIIGDQVRHIGGAAFSGCMLTEVEIGSNVEYIGSGAFSNNQDLFGISVDSTNPYYKSDDFGVVYDAEMATIICAPALLDANYVIPSTITAISQNAFHGCSRIKSIVMPDGISYVGSGAFWKCISLTTVVFPEMVDYFGSDMFSGCIELIEVNLPQNITSVGRAVFDNCVKLKEIDIPDTVTSIGLCAFYSCKSLERVILPNQLNSIGVQAFFACDELKEIIWPESLTSIGRSAFGQCTGLSELVLPDSLRSIGERAFSRCLGLTEVSLPDALVAINEGAFDECTNLKTVRIGKGLSSVGGNAFTNCNAIKEFIVSEDNPYLATLDGVLYSADYSTLYWYPMGKENTSFYIPDTVNTIAKSAFYRAENLYQIDIPDSIIEIGNTAFAYCTNLTNILLPDSVTSIGESCFHYCSSLSSICLPDSITNIPYGLFYGCTGLNSVKIPESITRIGGYAFHDCSNLLYIFIPSGVTDIGEAAFGACEKLNNITLPDGVKTIEDYLFDGCSSLNELKIPDTVIDIGLAVFRGCSSFEKIVIPEGIDGITPSLFMGCLSLSEVVIPDSVTIIGRDAFYGCKNLTTITVPSNVMTIDDNAFMHCSSLNEIIFKGDAPIIGYNVFSFVDTIGYYPSGNDTWTESVMQNYDGTITWKPYCTEGHTEEVIPGKSASCSETGLTEGKKCTICGVVTVEQKVIPTLGHTEETLPGKAATCTKTGLTEGKKCSVCGIVTVAQETVPATGIHVYENGICKYCGAVEPPIGDQLEDLVDNNASAEEIRDAVQNMDTEELKTSMEQDSAAVENIAALEQTVGGAAEITVEDASVGIAKKEVSVIGANLNPVVGGKSAILVIGAAAKKNEVPAEFEAASAVHFSMTLENVENTKQLEIPVKITLPVPENLDPDQVVVLHYHDGKTDILKPAIHQEGGKHFASIVLTGFSDFAIAQKTHEHSWVDATCTTPKICSVCKVTEGKPAGHTYDDNVDGTCNVCGVHREEVENRIVVHMFRMYNPNTGEHFYTGSEEERDNLIGHGWQYEGVGFTFPANTGAPVHRLFQPSTGEHLYTMDVEEKDRLMEDGWNYEGIAFNSAYDTEAVQHRLHNPNATVGAYHFTFSLEEKQNLIDAGWEYQGIGWYSCWK